MFKKYKLKNEVTNEQLESFGYVKWVDPFEQEEYVSYIKYHDLDYEVIIKKYKSLFYSYNAIMFRWVKSDKKYDIEYYIKDLIDNNLVDIEVCE